jgi:hypothetical protein
MKKVLIAIDIWIAVAIFQCPWNITLSAYSWKLEKDKKISGKIWRPVIDFLARIVAEQQDHCHRAWKHDMHSLGLGAE